MLITDVGVLRLLECVKIDSYSVVCHFKCQETKKIVISSVPFEPYEGSIVISWQDVLFHPVRSYNRYYHTPITIYGCETHETIVLKAFNKVATHFKWNDEKQTYTYI
jgi:hypothetical protein